MQAGAELSQAQASFPDKPDSTVTVVTSCHFSNFWNSGKFKFLLQFLLKLFLLLQVLTWFYKKIPRLLSGTENFILNSCEDDFKIIWKLTFCSKIGAKNCLYGLKSIFFFIPLFSLDAYRAPNRSGCPYSLELVR